MQGRTHHEIKTLYLYSRNMSNLYNTSFKRPEVAFEWGYDEGIRLAATSAEEKEKNKQQGRSSHKHHHKKHSHAKHNHEGKERVRGEQRKTSQGKIRERHHHHHHSRINDKSEGEEMIPTGDGVESGYAKADETHEDVSALAQSELFQECSARTEVLKDESVDVAVAGSHPLEDALPGAVAIGGCGDEESVLQQQGSSFGTTSMEPIVAERVDPEEEHRVLHEQIDKALREREYATPRAQVIDDNRNPSSHASPICSTKNKCLLIAGAFVIVVGLAIGITLGLLRPWEPAPDDLPTPTGAIPQHTTARGPGDWVQRGQDLDGEAAEDCAGFAVAISGDASTVAVGAYLNDGVNGEDSGHVRVYVWDAQQHDWSQLGQDIDGASPGDRSGRSVALSDDGRIVVVGARFHAINVGHARVFSFDETSKVWVQVGQDIDGISNFDYAGHSVALSGDGNIVAFGAIYNDNFATDAGQVKVFALEANGIWKQMGGDINGIIELGEAGRSVSLSNDGFTLAIGAPFDFENGSYMAGIVQVLTWNGNEWKQLGQILEGQVIDDGFGNSVSLSSNGRVVAVGAPFPTGDGFVEIHAYDGAIWVPLGNAIQGEDPNDQFGRSLALSSDGLTLAVGAYKNNGTGILSGSTRVLEYDGVAHAWKQVGMDIDGEAAYDRAGWSVSISSDGNTFVTGARLNDGMGESAGHGRVFNFVPL